MLTVIKLYSTIEFKSKIVIERHNVKNLRQPVKMKKANGMIKRKGKEYLAHTATWSIKFTKHLCNSFFPLREISPRKETNPSR